MKTVFLFLLLSISHLSLSQNKAKIFFIRTTGFQGAFATFKVFIDDTIVCKLTGDRYSIHEVSPGNHKFMAQFAGTKAKEGAKQEAIPIKCEAGKTYYLNLVIKRDFVNNLFCEEVTENTWKKLYANLKAEENCGIE